MNRCIGRLAALVSISSLAACGGGRQSHNMAGPAPSAAGMSSEVQGGLTRVRAATDRFHTLDTAVAAGYARDVPRCFSDPAQGAMGFHHVNRAIVDRQLDLDHPEILLFERHPDGGYVLNGVEFIIPYRLWPQDSTPPQLMGMDLMKEPDLRLWYLHMWTWKPNAKGLFEPYNPAVQCPPQGG